MEFLQFIIVAIVIESLWETGKMAWQSGKVNIDRVGAMVIGVVVAVGTGIDFLSAVNVPVYIPYLGSVLTGLLLSRGSNFVHDLINSIASAKTE